jgi:hypothetical protein
VNRFSTLVAALLLLSCVASTLSAQDKPQRRLVFSGGNDIGELWANVGLTGQRLDRDYLPMVIAVVNRSDSPVVIDRDAIRLVGPDGIRYPMPTITELRKGYDRLSLDYRAASGAGIPYDVWRRERRLMNSNFFPNISSLRSGIVIERVTLAPRAAMIDLVYFARPRDLARGVPFLLEAHAIGWQAPVRIGIVLN